MEPSFKRTFNNLWMFVVARLTNEGLGGADDPVVGFVLGHERVCRQQTVVRGGRHLHRVPDLW